jgi:hypothetical protein
MLLYAAKSMRDARMGNPTLVFITDRNDLDDQLFATFARCRELLRQPPVQAADRADLREKLKVAAGGVVFTTIQKFFPEERGDRHPVLSERRNIVVIADEAQRLLIQNDFDSPLELVFRARLEAWLRGPRLDPIRPLHWALEFPEVMRHGGFDAVVSNPPFIGGKKVSGALGADCREYLKQRVARDKPGNADLCSYFLLRDLAIAPQGRTGIIATNTIAQGDTREVGLDQAFDMGWTVYRAIKSQPWRNLSHRRWTPLPGPPLSPALPPRRGYRRPSAHTAPFNCWVRAVWAPCISHTTRNCNATSRPSWPACPMMAWATSG